IEAAGVVLELGLADLGVAVGQAADAELVQVRIPPAEGGLDDAMQLTKMEAARHDQATPDCRLNLGDLPKSACHAVEVRFNPTESRRADPPCDPVVPVDLASDVVLKHAGRFW